MPWSFKACKKETRASRFSGLALSWRYSFMTALYLGLQSSAPDFGLRVATGLLGFLESTKMMRSPAARQEKPAKVGKDIFVSGVGVDEGASVGVLVGVIVGVAVLVGVGVGVSVGLGVAVGVGVSVGASVAVTVAVGAAVAVQVGAAITSAARSWSYVGAQAARKSRDNRPVRTKRTDFISASAGMPVSITEVWR